jgi:hypothetical protein
MLPLVQVMMQTVSAGLRDIQPTVGTASRKSWRTGMAPHHNRAPAISGAASAVGEWKAALSSLSRTEKQARGACVFPMLAIVLTAFAVKGTRSAKSELSPSGCRPAVTGYRTRWGIDHAEPLRRATSHASSRWAGASRSRTASRLRVSSSWTSIGRGPHHTLPHPANAGRAAQRHYHTSQEFALDWAWAGQQPRLK